VTSETAAVVVGFDPAKNDRFAKGFRTPAPCGIVVRGAGRWDLKTDER